MMDQFTVEDLKRLVESADEPAVSIYMPTDRAGPDVRQNATRFKNLIKAAAKRLERQFPDDQSFSARLDEAAKLESDDQWWQHQSDGLALFLDATRLERYRIPFPFDEWVHVGRQFEVRPLIRLLQSDGKFLILALSQNCVRLLEGSRFSIKEIDAPQLPSDLRSALNIDEYTDSLQQHSTGGPAIAGTMTFHGQGASDPDIRKKTEISQFFHRIEKALAAYLNSQRLPLVVASVDYLFPLFREICQYEGLADQPVIGNPDNLSAEELHRQAWAVVAPDFDRQQDEAIEQFNNDAGGPNTVGELTDVVLAARQGAIDTLILAEGARVWGSIDEQTGQVQLTEENAVGAEDLLNEAAIFTLANGGTVYSVPQQQMPDQQPVAALLRYPLPSAQEGPR
jgi:hypothetical protein